MVQINPPFQTHRFPINRMSWILKNPNGAIAGVGTSKSGVEAIHAVMSSSLIQVLQIFTTSSCPRRRPYHQFSLCSYVSNFNSYFHSGPDGQISSSQSEFDSEISLSNLHVCAGRGPLSLVPFSNDYWGWIESDPNVIVTNLRPARIDWVYHSVCSYPPVRDSFLGPMWFMYPGTRHPLSPVIEGYSTPKKEKKNEQGCRKHEISSFHTNVVRVLYVKM